MTYFREACFQGIPDEAGIRSKAWRVLLGYLPADKRKWRQVLSEQRKSYYNWVSELLNIPGDEPPSADHPLNSQPDSKWAVYFQDNAALEQIDKDVRRTLPDFAFFQLPVPKSPLNPLSPPVEEEEEEEENEEAVETKKDLEIGEDSNDKSGRLFPFGLGRRPRSSSTASRKSTKSTKGNRSRSNSKSSVKSMGTGIESSDPLTKISSPLNMVRRFSHALKGSPTLQQDMHRRLDHQNYHQKEIDYTKYEVHPRILNRRSLFKRIAHLNKDFGAREHQDMKKVKAKKGGASLTEGGSEEHLKVDSYKIQDLHWEAIERLLFIYVKLNPGVGYVQGMNELLGPIYYVFAQDSDDVEAQAHAEADSFFVFSLLMSDVRDHFTRTLDHDANTGINATMTRMSDRLKWMNPKLWRNLTVDKEIKEQFYAFRWITVLYTQEWDLPDVIRIWDSLLADRCMQTSSSATASQGLDRFQFLLDFSVAMVICVTDELLAGDFAENIRLLQNYPINDLQVVLNRAYAIREKRLKLEENGGSMTRDVDDRASITSVDSVNRLKHLFNSESSRASWDRTRNSLDDMFRSSWMGNAGKRGSMLSVATTESAPPDMTSRANGMVRNLGSRFSLIGRRSANSLNEADYPASSFPAVKKDGQTPRTTTSGATGPSKQTNGPSVFERFSNFVANNHNAPLNEQPSLSTSERFKRDVAQQLGPNPTLEDEAALQASLAARTVMYDSNRQYRSQDQGYSGLI
ncbi:unnamed protein product [Umbelopsis ramanniana]